MFLIAAASVTMFGLVVPKRINKRVNVLKYLPDTSDGNPETFLKALLETENPILDSIADNILIVISAKKLCGGRKDFSTLFYNSRIVMGQMYWMVWWRGNLGYRFVGEKKQLGYEREEK